MTSNIAIFESLKRRRIAFMRCMADGEVRDVAQSLTDTCYTKPRLDVCPCCAYPTLTCRESTHACELCGWCDDGQDDPGYRIRFDYYGPDDIAGGPNYEYTLTEARLNFSRYQQKWRPTDKQHFDRFQATKAARKALVDAFDSLLPSVNPTSYIAALPKINALFAALYEMRWKEPYPGRAKTKEWYEARRGRAERRRLLWRKLLKQADIDLKHDD